MKIIVDAMGGDFAPGPQVEGSVRAARELGVEIVLVGKQDVLQKKLQELGYSEGKITIRDAADIITNDDEPAKALRRKKDASIVVAANMLKNGEGDGLVSTGATGGVLAAGLLIVGRIEGVLRPALAPVLPTDTGPALLVDGGANADCKAANLLQFGIMGSAYAGKVLGKENAKVALVNIGAEEHKGNDVTRAAYEMLKKAPINFTGNIEGREIMDGAADVIVCDGFVGNVILKLTEGLAATLLRNIKNMFLKNFATKLCALGMKGPFSEFKKKMDYTEYGGALLLGLKHPVIKGHGSSDAKAVYSAIRQAKKFVSAGVVEQIKEDLEKMEETQNGIES